MPDAASDLLRSDPDLQTFQAGLTATDVAVIVNDTNTHLTRTVFAPTNEAFKSLGTKANKFLFSPLGRTYLTALLQYHVVMNRTLFTDVYFKPDTTLQGKMNFTPGYTEQVQMNTSSKPVR